MIKMINTHNAHTFFGHSAYIINDRNLFPANVDGSIGLAAHSVTITKTTISTMLVLQFMQGYDKSLWTKKTPSLSVDLFDISTNVCDIYQPKKLLVAQLLR
jgi:hypothetical protein